MIYLTIYCDDSFEVFKDKVRLGVIHPSFQGWAVHLVTYNNYVIERRATTTKDIPAAVRYIEQNSIREAA